MGTPRESRTRDGSSMIMQKPWKINVFAYHVYYVDHGESRLSVSKLYQKEGSGLTVCVLNNQVIWNAFGTHLEHLEDK